MTVALDYLSVSTGLVLLELELNQPTPAWMLA